MVVLKWIFSLLPFAYMAAIWVMSSLPSNALVELPDSNVDRFLKESLHLVEFAILYGLFVGAALTTRRPFTARVNLLLALVAGCYGIADEIHQSFYPYRSATVIDLVKDWTGVLVCWYLVRGAYFGGRFGGLGKLLRWFEGQFREVKKNY
jgi:VanZ family protein